MPTIVYTRNTTGGDSAAIDDLSLRSGTPTTNWYAGEEIGSATSDGSAVEGTTILKLTDLSDIPAGSTITGVQVSLNRISGYSASGMNVNLHRILRTVVLTQATWNIYSTGNSWTTGGALGSGTDITGTPAGSIASDNSNGYKTATDGGLIALVQGWLDGTIDNNGILLATELVDEAYFTAGSCYATDGTRPIITIAYTEPDDPAVLSSPTPSGTLGTETTASVGATTDVSSGTLYAVLSTSNNVSGASASQIKAGNNSGGTSATHADDAAVSTTSPSVGFTGLTANTLYYYALAQSSAGGDSNVVSGSFTTAAAAITATKCAFTTQPANTVVGQTMANVQVSLLDGSDNLDSDNTSDVVIALQTGSGTLAGTLTRAAVAGVATFNDLSINTLNTDAVLRATSSGLTQADSDEFDITAGTGSGAGGSLIGSALISS